MPSYFQIPTLPGLRVQGGLRAEYDTTPGGEISIFSFFILNPFQSGLGPSLGMKTCQRTLKHHQNHPKMMESDFPENHQETASDTNFSTSNIQISHADACVRCCAGSQGPFHMVRSTLFFFDLDLELGQGKYGTLNF